MKRNLIIILTLFFIVLLAKVERKEQINNAIKYYSSNLYNFEVFKTKMEYLAKACE